MMAQLMSHDDMYGILIISAHEHDVQRRSCFGSCRRLANYDERTSISLSSNNSDGKMKERSESFKPM